MLVPLLSQRVGVFPLSSYECQAAGPRPIHCQISIPFPFPTTSSVGWLCMTVPSWWRETGQQAAPVTREPHLSWGVGVILINSTSRNQECWKLKLQCVYINTNYPSIKHKPQCTNMTHFGYFLALHIQSCVNWQIKKKSKSKKSKKKIQTGLIMSKLRGQFGLEWYRASTKKYFFMKSKLSNIQGAILFVRFDNQIGPGTVFPLSGY